MVVSSPVLCSHSTASQSVAVSAVCCKHRLLDAHPDRRRLPFSISDKTTGTSHRCVSSASRRTVTCSCSCHSQKASALGQAREQAQAKRTAWQLRATRNSKQDRVTKQTEEVKAKQGDSNIMSQFSGLVNELLYGAASRMERGQTTCIACKGSGTCVCANCKGQGIMQAKQLQKAKDPVRQAANKVQSMLGGSSSTSYSTTALRSNRCPKCHGNGQLVCHSCEGRGFRGDFD